MKQKANCFAGHMSPGTRYFVLAMGWKRTHPHPHPHSRSARHQHDQLSSGGNLGCTFACLGWTVWRTIVRCQKWGLVLFSLKLTSYLAAFLPSFASCKCPRSFKNRTATGPETVVNQSGADRRWLNYSVPALNSAAFIFKKKKKVGFIGKSSNKRFNVDKGLQIGPMSRRWAAPSKWGSPSNQLANLLRTRPPSTPCQQCYYSQHRRRKGRGKINSSFLGEVEDFASCSVWSRFAPVVVKAVRTSVALWWLSATTIVAAGFAGQTAEVSEEERWQRSDAVRHTNGHIFQAHIIERKLWTD